MGLPADYHMHTPLCRHATGDPVQYAARAAEIGLQEIGFSDHSPMLRDDFDDWRMRFDQADDYVAGVRKARKAFPNLAIRMALEVDYLPGQENWIRKLATMHPWDYLIGSVHYISETWAIDDPRRLSEWDQHDVWEVWSAYFERLTEAARTGFFDIIGHADLPKKFGKRPDRDCTPLYQKFLDAVVRQGCAIELNTAGLRKECREIYPGRDLLRLAHEKRVPITFGSDAHAPAEVGSQFEEAVRLASEVGYTHSCRFIARKREMVKLRS